VKSDLKSEGVKMGKMTAEKAAKMLAEDGESISLEDATIVVDFLRKLAKIAVAQYLREEEELLRNTEDENKHEKI
jgi:hypothetical protein